MPQIEALTIKDIPPQARGAVAAKDNGEVVNLLNSPQKERELAGAIASQINRDQIASDSNALLLDRSKDAWKKLATGNPGHSKRIASLHSALERVHLKRREDDIRHRPHAEDIVAFPFLQITGPGNRPALRFLTDMSSAHGNPNYAEVADSVKTAVRSKNGADEKQDVKVNLPELVGLYLTGKISFDKQPPKH